MFHLYRCRKLYETFLEWSNPSAIFIGYNSISFDGPFLRQAFYQNLMPEIYMPVTSGNTQMDVFDIAKLVSVFHPEHIRVNKDEKGYAILKLESLAEANDLKIQYEAGPHDAVYDALITLELAKMLSIRCPKIFEASLEFRKRDTPKKFMLENNVFTNLTFWGRRPSIKDIQVSRGISERNHSYYGLNILFDPEEMSKLDEKELCKKTIDGTNRITEVFDGSKSKTLLNESYCFKDSKFAEIGIDTLRKRAKFIRENEEFSSRLVECHLKNSKTWPEPVEIEERIFDDMNLLYKP